MLLSSGNCSSRYWLNSSVLYQTSRPLELEPQVLELTTSRKIPGKFGMRFISALYMNPLNSESEARTAFAQFSLSTLQLRSTTWLSLISTFNGCPCSLESRWDPTNTLSFKNCHHGFPVCVPLSKNLRLGSFASDMTDLEGAGKNWCQAKSSARSFIVQTAAFRKCYLQELPQFVPVALGSPLMTGAVFSFSSMKPTNAK